MNATQTLLNTIDRQTRHTLREHDQWLRRMGMNEEAERFEKVLTRPLGDVLAFLVGVEANESSEKKVGPPCDIADPVEHVRELRGKTEPTLLDIPDSLTYEEYLPMAASTMDPDLVGSTATHRKARLMYLCLGAVEELEEFRLACRRSGGFCIEEAGDVLWYAEQALAELPQPTVYTRPARLRAETIKKAIVHERREHLERVIGFLLYAKGDVEYRAKAENIPLEQIYAANVAKLAARFPNGFVAGGGKR